MAGQAASSADPARPEQFSQVLPEVVDRTRGLLEQPVAEHVLVLVVEANEGAGGVCEVELQPGNECLKRRILRLRGKILRIGA